MSRRRAAKSRELQERTHAGGPPERAVPGSESVGASRRKEASEQRRQAILDAGLDVFGARGFAAARLDDVAEKANVAKGTIYLSFRDKEDLFEQIVLGAVSPILARLAALAEADDVPLEMFLIGLHKLFREEVLGTRRKEVLRLVISEGGRFPRIAEFYHREVIGKGSALIRRMAARSLARGEPHAEHIARYPQLVMAPLLVSVIWDGLFSSIEPLDVEGMLAAHRAMLLGYPGAGGTR
jgi:AcrR family transcriptional regulator